MNPNGPHQIPLNPALMNTLMASLQSQPQMQTFGASGAGTDPVFMLANFQQQQQSQQSVGPSATLNGAAHKRPMIQPQANGLMGGMGGGARQPGRGGLTIEHILQRLSGVSRPSRLLPCVHISIGLLIQLDRYELFTVCPWFL